MAHYARAFSTATVNRAHPLQYWFGVARFLVFFHREAMGLESGAYDGHGGTVMRSACWAKHGVVGLAAMLPRPIRDETQGLRTASRSGWPGHTNAARGLPGALISSFWKVMRS